MYGEVNVPIEPMITGGLGLGPIFPYRTVKYSETFLIN